MSILEFNVDDFLGDSIPDSGDSLLTESGDADSISLDSWKEPEYEGSIDYRIRQLSYSSILTLHNCPRKFQLYKLRTTHKTAEDEKSTITFAFGHVVGEGIQMVLEDKSEQEIFFKMFLGWHAELFATNDKDKKSFFDAIIAIQRFIALRKQGFMREYELVYYKDKPATELSFCINFPESFRLRGHVDAVLRHKDTGEILVLECKTTNSSNVNPAAYKNSAQAIGYSVVLDNIYPELSSYSVLYLVYETKTGQYVPIPFHKTYLQRALWIRELLLDIETIKMYEAAEVYPMRGESCFSFYRECEYLNTCTLSTSFLTKPCTPDQEDKIEYQVNITLADLLDSQFKKLEPLV